MRVLIVDDDEANLRLLEIIFGREGHEPIRAFNGQEALQKAREQKPDLVISDILMPVMDGFSLCREWMKDSGLRTVPFVFYTSTYQADEDEALALSLGAARFLRKPMEPLLFLSQIERVFEDANAGRLPPPGPPLEDEAQYLRRYNSRLVEKLEKRHQELARSEARYRLLFEGSKDGIVLSDAETGILEEVNEALCALVGRPREDLQNHPLTVLHPPEEVARYHQIFKDFAAGKLDPADLDLVVQAASGGRIPVDISCSRLVFQGRHFLLGIFRDRRDAKAKQAALEESEEKYRTILESMQESYYEVDLTGNFTFFNDSLCRLLGYPREELMGMNDRQLTDADNAKKLYQAFNAIHRGGEPTQEVNWEIIRKDGSKRTIDTSVSSRKDASGKPLGFRGIIRDVTEEKRAEEALRASEAHYRELFDRNVAGVYRSQVGQPIMQCNPAFARIFGYDSPEEVYNVPAGGFFATSEDHRAYGERLLAQKVLTNTEVQCVRKDGTPLWILENVALVEEPGGETFVEGTIVDITEQKNAEAERRTLEEQLLRNKTLETIGMLANGVAHEVRNPLNSIRIVAAALEKKLGAASEYKEYKEYMDYINEHVDRLSRLMGDLLLMGRPQDPALFVSCDLLVVVREAVSNIEAADPSAQGRFAMKASAESFGVWGIQSKLVQVFVNLLSNAHSFSPEGAQVEVKLFVEGGKATVTMSDRGSGIPPKLLPSLFQPFQSQRKGGTGLGLAIVQKTVEGHGGAVEAANNNPGPGACFTVRLPLA